MLAALLITASLAAPATLTDGKVHKNRPVLIEKAKQKAAPMQLAQANLGIDPNAPNHEVTFIEQFFSFSLASQALPQVKDGLVLSHVMGYLLPCGGLWGPVVFIEGAEFSGDAIISYLVSGLLWSLAISVVSALTFGIGFVAFLALPYLMTTATLNAVDRDLKKKGSAPVVKGTPGSNSGPATPPPPDTPPPSYAY